MRSTLHATILFVLALGAAACPAEKGTAEKTGQKVDEAVKDLKDKKDDLVQRAGDKLDQAAHDVKTAAEDVKKAVEDATEEE